MSAPIDRLQMPRSAIDALVKAFPDDVVRAIVGDHYQRAAPTPAPANSIVDQLVEKFGPKAD